MLVQFSNHGKKKILNPYFTLRWKLISDYIPNCGRYNNKAFRGKYLHDFGVGKDFLNTQKVFTREIHKRKSNCTTLNLIPGHQKRMNH